MNRLDRAVAGVGLAAWLAGVALVGAVAAGWHDDSPTPQTTPTERTERVCYRDGTLSLETVLPDGRRIATDVGHCHYTPHSSSEKDR